MKSWTLIEPHSHAESHTGIYLITKGDGAEAVSPYFSDTTSLSVVALICHKQISLGELGDGQIWGSHSYLLFKATAG